jgi:pyruvate,water dikinase
MLRPEVAGIAFSRDPVHPAADRCVVSATTGTGDALVLGQVEGVTWHVGGDGRVTGADGGAPPALLPEARVREVAALARKAEAHFGRPQDTEWAIAQGRLWLLQSRPITTIAAAGPPEAPLLWDNSNIVESYSGVTSPLTFSFARGAYDSVYRTFVRVLGVSARTVARHEDMFPNMLGYIQGRVYYNLANWYRLMAMLPGFAFNRGFMEQMMGVGRPLPPEWLARVSPPAAGAAERIVDLPRLAWTALRILVSWAFLPLTIRSFLARLERALGGAPADLRAMNLMELARHYRALDGAIRARWDAPILNDFYTMVFHGLAGGALRRWAGQDGAVLHTTFLRSGRRLLSAEPARLLVEMAGIAAADPALRAALAGPDPAARDAAIAANPAFRALFDGYVARFGDRCIQELKLESPTLSDDPAPLLGVLATMAAQPRRAAATAVADPEAELRRLFEGRPVRRILTRWLLRTAKRHVHDRETLRFERTRVFGRARRIFLAIGDRFAALGMLRDPRDVFLLEVQEILGAIEGTATTWDLAALAALRGEQMRRFRAAPDPPNRFETQGPPPVAAPPPAPGAAPPRIEGGVEERTGLASSPGQVRGRARVIRDPQGACIAPGEILVARHTDPGWVLLFGNAAGVVVERGSLLSHSAIVARELNLPAVVSIPGLMEWLEDGDEIEVDGTAGRVRRLAHAG